MNASENDENDKSKQKGKRKEKNILTYMESTSKRRNRIKISFSVFT